MPKNAKNRDFVKKKRKTIKNGQPIMSKKSETKLIAELRKFQEHREYNQGLKHAEQLCRKDPQCAEALAYKAYFTFMKDKSKKDECVTMAKQANRLDMKSAEVWKVCGLLYREMNDFVQYLQCYRLSYRINSTDPTVLSEICNLNFFFGNYEEFYQTTRTLLASTSTVWIVMRYALALWFTGNYSSASEFLDVYESGLAPPKNDEDAVFRSELCIFHLMIYLKLENFNKALEYIEKNSIFIRDSVRLNEIKYKIYTALGQNDKAMEILNELIKYYPENGDYFDILENIIPKDQIIDKLIELKDSASSKYAWVRALEIMDVSDARYEPLLRKYLEPLLIKASPAAYISLKDLPEAGIDLCFKIANEIQVPMNAIPMVKLFKAFIYYRRGDLENALKEIDEGLAHTTTAIELLQWRCKFLKGHGRIKESLRYARKFANADSADRNANNLFAQCLLLNGLTKVAEDTASVFAGTENGRPLLFETQFSTYYLRAGLAYLRKGDIAKAKEFYDGIFKHFDEYRKGEYNYIGWASKKPRALIELQDMLNNMEKEYLFYEAANFALRLALLENRAKDFLPQTLQSMKSLNPETLALAAHVFAANKLHLPAVRCWVKIGESPFRYLALPAMKKLKAEPAKEALVNEVFNQFFDDSKLGEPKTADELFASAEGKSIEGDANEAKKDLFAAISLGGQKYKKVLRLHTIVKTFFKDPQDALNKFQEVYPKFEFDLMDEQQYLDKYSREAKAQKRKQNTEEQQQQQ